jgi:CheY-like chemotaxis protein
MNDARILCLDDDPVGLAVRVKVLQYAGYTVFTASSAEEALQILADQHIDIVISDYLLPGTTGTQVAASMKQIRPDVPVLILSGVTELPEGIEFADFFLSKLEPPPVLLATVAGLLAQREAVMHDAATSGHEAIRKAG